MANKHSYFSYCIDCKIKKPKGICPRCRKCGGKERISRRKDIFFKKVSKTESCWIWMGCKDSNGYGLFSGGPEKRCHRISWIFSNGPIPEKLQILHKCDVRSCVNPSHLWAGTQSENIRDMILKKRHKGGIGGNNCKAKLSEKEVIEIRNVYSPKRGTLISMAKRFNVDSSTILDIIKRRSWKHI